MRGGGRRWAAVRHLAAYFSSESMCFVNVHFAVSINFLKKFTISLKHYRNGVSGDQASQDVNKYLVRGFRPIIPTSNLHIIYIRCKQLELEFNEMQISHSFTTVKGNLTRTVLYYLF